jgi:hypothetical protein
MGNESIGCSGPPCAVAVTPFGIRLQSRMQSRRSTSRGRCLSRLPYQPVPAPPIDLEIPVIAIDEAQSSLIEETTTVMAESLFERQCRDQLARRLRERTSIDPMWERDKHGLLVQRLPSGELQVHVSPSVSRDGPCSIVTPVAEDNSDLRRETAFQIAKLSR